MRLDGFGPRIAAKSSIFHRPHPTKGILALLAAGNPGQHQPRTASKPGLQLDCMNLIKAFCQIESQGTRVAFEFRSKTRPQPAFMCRLGPLLSEGCRIRPQSVSSRMPCPSHSSDTARNSEPEIPCGMRNSSESSMGRTLRCVHICRGYVPPNAFSNRRYAPCSTCQDVRYCEYRRCKT